MKKKTKVLKNFEIDSAYNALSLLTKKTRDTVVRFRIAENIKHLSDPRETWIKERTSIIEQHTEKGEDGNPKVDGNRFVWSKPEAEKSVLELDNTQTEVTYVPIMLSRLCDDMDRSGSVIEISELFPLVDWLIFDDIVDLKESLENKVANNE